MALLYLCIVGLASEASLLIKFLIPPKLSPALRDFYQNTLATCPKELIL